MEPTQKQLDWPMCERCEKEVRTTTVDIWVQRARYWQVAEIGTGKDVYVDVRSEELNEGRDYIVLCEACWAKIRETVWNALCEATTCDARTITVQYGPETHVLLAEPKAKS